MVKMYEPKQGDIIILNFSPQSGHEQGGKRPGLIVSSENFFIKARLAIVCPITNTNKNFPLHIPLDDRTETTGVILTEHIRCVDIFSRGVQFVETIPHDLLDKVLLYIDTFFEEE